MSINELTVEQVRDIQSLRDKYNNDAPGWKKAMMLKAKDFGLTDSEILAVNRGLGI